MYAVNGIKVTKATRKEIIGILQREGHRISSSATTKEVREFLSKLDTKRAPQHVAVLPETSEFFFDYCARVDCTYKEDPQDYSFEEIVWGRMNPGQTVAVGDGSALGLSIFKKEIRKAMKSRPAPGARVKKNVDLLLQVADESEAAMSRDAQRRKPKAGYVGQRPYEPREHDFDTRERY